MYITKANTNKITLLIDLARVDECYAVDIEGANKYKFEDVVETLAYMDIELENAEDFQMYFEESSAIINKIAEEIKNGDMKIHINKKYGSEALLE